VKRRVELRFATCSECAFDTSKRPLSQERRRTWASRFLADVYSWAV
jgi:hypothetical protein